jgi:hypothetical protein
MVSFAKTGSSRLSQRQSLSMTMGKDSRQAVGGSGDRQALPSRGSRKAMVVHSRQCGPPLGGRGSYVPWCGPPEGESGRCAYRKVHPDGGGKLSSFRRLDNLWTILLFAKHQLSTGSHPSYRHEEPASPTTRTALSPETTPNVNQALDGSTMRSPSWAAFSVAAGAGPRSTASPCRRTRAPTSACGTRGGRACGPSR